MASAVIIERVIAIILSIQFESGLDPMRLGYVHGARVSISDYLGEFWFFYSLDIP